VSLLLPGLNDAGSRAAAALAYRLVLLSECKRPPAPGARTNLLLRAWIAAGERWPQSRRDGIGLPGENRFLRWLIGDGARACAVIAAARQHVVTWPEDHRLQRGLGRLADRAGQARLDAARPWRGPTGLAGSILSAYRRWYCSLPL